MAGGNLLRLLALAVQADLARAALFLSLSMCADERAKAEAMRRGGYLPTPRFGDEEIDGSKLEQWRLHYWECSGWKLLQDATTYDPKSRQGKEFRAVTRISRQRFDYLLSRLERDDKLADNPRDGRGRPPKVPLALKLLSTLAVLGSGLSFEWAFLRYCGTDAGNGRKVFHSITEWLVKYEYDMWVFPPTEESDIRRTEARFAQMGFPGCITCFDGVHWAWNNAPAGRRFMYAGKEGYPSLVFNVACDSNTRIHHVHGSNPGAVNDKTMARYDEFMIDMHLLGKYSSQTFLVYDHITEVLQPRQGLYAIVDGGYHFWRVTQAPVKCASREWDRRWSKRLESVRKCVECVFGRLKKRFLVLAKPSTVKSEYHLTNIFKVCCMLHNMLLVDDGLDDIGDRPSDWAHADTDADDVRIRRSMVEQGAEFTPRVVHAVDDARVGNDTVAEAQSGYCVLQQDLITHYRVAWQKKEVMWAKGAVKTGRKRADLRPLLPGGYPSEYYRFLVEAGEESSHWFDGLNWHELGEADGDDVFM